MIPHELYDVCMKTLAPEISNSFVKDFEGEIP